MNRIQEFFANIDLSLYIPHIMLVIVLGMILYFAHKSKESTFNVFDYFTDRETGKASITRTLQLVAGVTATWVIVQFTATGKLTYDIFGLYLAAVGASEAWTKYVAAKFGARTKDSKTDGTSNEV